MSTKIRATYVVFEYVQASLTRSNILSVYALAKKFQFKAASSICDKIMADNLKPSNFLQILTL